MGRKGRSEGNRFSGCLVKSAVDHQAIGQLGLHGDAVRASIGRRFTIRYPFLTPYTSQPKIVVFSPSLVASTTSHSLGNNTMWSYKRLHPLCNSVTP